MTPLLLIASTIIMHCFAGEVSQLGYEPKEEFFWYREGSKNDDKLLINRTPQGHKFLLAIDYRRNKHYNSGFLRGTSVDYIEYQNRMQIYYNSYLLDSIKVPKIDSLDCNIYAVDNSILTSIHPKTPDPESDTPYEIWVYYSLTNGDCLRGINSKKTLVRSYYAKEFKDSVVDNKYCS